MISYELAKDLKDAGLHQGGDGYMLPQLMTNGAFEPDEVYVPTLQELVRWCGDEFRSLTRPSWQDIMKNGVLDLNKGGVPFMWYAEDVDNSRFLAHTPEEAVASLGKAIHGRNKENTK